MSVRISLVSTDSEEWKHNRSKMAAKSVMTENSQSSLNEDLSLPSQPHHKTRSVSSHAVHLVQLMKGFRMKL